MVPLDTVNDVYYNSVKKASKTIMLRIILLPSISARHRIKMFLSYDFKILIFHVKPMYFKYKKYITKDSLGWKVGRRHVKQMGEIHHS